MDQEISIPLHDGTASGVCVSENTSGTGKSSVCAQPIMDIHVHLPGHNSSGCRISEYFAGSDAHLQSLSAIGCRRSEENAEKILGLRLNAVAASKMDKIVLHALDGVYKNGRQVWSESDMVIPNDYIKNISLKNSRVLFGASLHPYRDPAELIKETERCLGEGAVLFQWMPSVQQIDPEDSR